MPKSNNKKIASALGAGLAAAATAIAGAYYFYGKKGASRRKKVADKFEIAKAEVAKQVKKLGHIDKKSYLALVSKVGAGYEAFKDFDKSELQSLVKELKSHWQTLAKEMKSFNLTKPQPKKPIKKSK